MQDINRKIAHLMEQLGEGLPSEPCAYATGWVARIPAFAQPNQPAFPLSLAWLREHQLEDGSWRVSYPVMAFDITLNTLSAIIALAKWENECDKAAIKQGVEALWRSSTSLASESKSVGFAFLLPTLLKEAKQYNLAIPYETYDQYAQFGQKQLRRLTETLAKRNYNKSNFWQAVFLEMLWGNWTPSTEDVAHLVQTLLLENGSAGTSPAATAYLLMLRRLHGGDIPEAVLYLKEIAAQCQNGFPAFTHWDTFELSWCIDYFLQSGMAIDNPVLAPAVKQLTKYWGEHEALKQGISFSHFWEGGDADTTAVVTYVLQQKDNINAEYLMRFFGKDWLEKNKSVAALSQNLHSLKAFRACPQVPEIEAIIQAILTWINTSALASEYVLIEDMCHATPYYTLSTAVFSLYGLDDALVKRCIDHFLQHQTINGGWGKGGFATLEETAYVALALCYYIRQGHTIEKTVLINARHFLLKTDLPQSIPFHFVTTLFTLPLISKASILAAQVALNEILD